MLHDKAHKKAASNPYGYGDKARRQSHGHLAPSDAPLRRY